LSLRYAGRFRLIGNGPRIFLALIFLAV
jgi:hypothetical protein